MPTYCRYLKILPIDTLAEEEENDDFIYFGIDKQTKATNECKTLFHDIFSCHSSSKRSIIIILWNKHQVGTFHQWIAVDVHRSRFVNVNFM